MLSLFTKTKFLRKFRAIPRHMSTSESHQCLQEEVVSVLPWKFDNLALRSLPVDPLPWNTPGSRQVPNACFSRVRPALLDNPQMVAYSLPAMNLLFSPHNVTDEDMAHPVTVKQLSGCALIPGSEPASHCYCGYQFGSFAGQLGDGAAMYLGEMVNGRGERWEIQLKGAGKTPYSRSADGRKVLRSSIREFLCSEAMHALGVPTTRAATCITSDSRIDRDIFYTGNVIFERCSVVSRLAPSFIRFGSFEICKPQDKYTGRQGPSLGNKDILPQLLTYVVSTFYPEIWQKYVQEGTTNVVREGAFPQMSRDFILEVVRRTAKLVAHWQTVGFCHGVLNTDNMSVLGLTLDYGPFGFMDRFDPNFVSNTSDDQGRYSFTAQPEICLWNCVKLREALLDLLRGEDAENESALSEREVQDEFRTHFRQHYEMLMRGKLGLLTLAPVASSSASSSAGPDGRSSDAELFQALLDTMETTGADFTLTFLTLTNLLRGHDKAPSIEALLFEPNENKPTTEEDKVREVAEFIVQRVCYSLEDMLEGMMPVFSEMDAMILALYGNTPGILRRLGGDRIFKNLEAVDKHEKMKSMTEEEKHIQDVRQWSEWLVRYLQRLRADQEQYMATGTKAAPDWWTAVREQMSSSNPRVVLRNHLAQLAIQWADQPEKPDFTGVQRLLARLMRPFEDDRPGEEIFSAASCAGPATSTTMDEEAAESGGSCSMPRPQPVQWLSRPPKWAKRIRVSCSS